MSNTLSLATRLRAMSDGELGRILRERAIAAHGIKDFFDLAEALLDRASIQQALTRLDRHTLAVLVAITAQDDPSTVAEIAGRLPGVASTAIADRAAVAVELLLAESESGRYSAYESVRDQLRSWPAFGLPGLADLADLDPPAALEPVPDVDTRFIDRLAAERAFAAITSITELLSELEREPARELAKGGVALPDTKRLANAMSVDLPSVATFVDVVERADLVARESGSWMITERGREWILLPSRGKWGALAAAWSARLPPDIRQLLGERAHALWGNGLRTYIDWLYPAGGDWMDERVATYTRDAELLGVTANQAPSTPGALLLGDGVDAAEAAMAPLLPQEVEQVYLQHDLSVVAPGPLAPAVDARLRGLADVENRALASSYRVSTSSVNRAMAAGETRESMLEFLRGISLTGIPQPLDYLIDEASSRYGTVRVGSRDDRTYVRSEDSAMLDAILVDQNLSALAFTRESATTATSRFPLDVVFWSLSDARYPVAAERDGAILSLKRQRTARPAAASTVSPIDSLIERLRLGGDVEPEEEGQAWLLRQLEVAIKSHVGLTVSVRMPNGSVVDYQLEPTGVGGGRLRARDNKSQIERTLPLTSIAGLGPAQPV
jgi:hypothetical protein